MIVGCWVVNLWTYQPNWIQNKSNNTANKSNDFDQDLGNDCHIKNWYPLLSEYPSLQNERIYKKAFQNST